MMAMSGADSPFCTLPLDFSLAVYLLYFCPLVHALSLSLSTQRHGHYCFFEMCPYAVSAPRIWPENESTYPAFSRRLDRDQDKPRGLLSPGVWSTTPTAALPDSANSFFALYSASSRLGSRA